MVAIVAPDDTKHWPRIVRTEDILVQYTNPLAKPLIDGLRHTDISDQIPYGDFTPAGECRFCEGLGTRLDFQDNYHECLSCDGQGEFPQRYAWLFDNIQAIEPISKYGRPCGFGTNLCTVSVRGRQGLWTPDAELVTAVEKREEQ